MKTSAISILAAAILPLILAPAASASAASNQMPTRADSAATSLPDPALAPATQATEFLKTHPEATRSGSDTVSWSGGTVILTFRQTSARTQAAQATVALSSAAATTAAIKNCDYPYVCLYENQNFAGRKLQFKDCGSVQDLYVYGFNDMTTSVVNLRARGLYLNDNSDGTGLKYFVPNSTNVPNLGTGFNDKASSVFLQC